LTGWLPEQILYEQPLDVKENDERALHLSHLFGLGEFGLAIQRPVYGSCCLPQLFI
jgi:hypothetical protein